MTDEKVGRFCEVHNEYAPTGFCRWCEPETAKEPMRPGTKFVGVNCRCGAYVFHSAAPPPLERFEPDRIHTPTYCTPRAVSVDAPELKPVEWKLLPPGPQIRKRLDEQLVQLWNDCMHKYAGIPVKVDPTLKPDEFRFVPPRLELEHDALRDWVRCACGLLHLSSALAILREGNDEHSVDRCEIRRKDQPPRSG